MPLVTRAASPSRAPAPVATLFRSLVSPKARPQLTSRYATRSFLKPSHPQLSATVRPRLSSSDVDPSPQRPSTPTTLSPSSALPTRTRRTHKPPLPSSMASPLTAAPLRSRSLVASTRPSAAASAPHLWRAAWTCSCRMTRTLARKSQRKSLSPRTGIDVWRAYRKLRSDELMATDSRAHVLVAPPGADPKDYTPQERGRGRGRGRGGRRRGGRGGAAKMDLDR